MLRLLLANLRREIVGRKVGVAIVSKLLLDLRGSNNLLVYQFANDVRDLFVLFKTTVELHNCGHWTIKYPYRLVTRNGFT